MFQTNLKFFRRKKGKKEARRTKKEKSRTRRKRKSKVMNTSNRVKVRFCSKKKLSDLAQNY